MKRGPGVSVAHLALCKEGGLVDRSCMPLASRGNSSDAGRGRNASVAVITGCFTQISACFFMTLVFSSCISLSSLLSGFL